MSRIIWLEDSRKFAYLREGRVFRSRRKGEISLKHNRLVAYEDDLPKNSFSEHQIRMYERRIWFLKSQDYDMDPKHEIYSPENGNSPSEAVFPSSVSTDAHSVKFTWEQFLHPETRNHGGEN